MESIAENKIRKDRILLLGGLFFILALSWSYMFYLGGSMTDVKMTMVKPPIQSWSLIDLFFLFIMWTVMMIAMMLPSATPMILTFSRLIRQNSSLQKPFGISAIFLLGYLTVWTGFSFFAALLQLYLHNVSLLSSTMVSNNSLFGGILLVSIGAFQFTSIKNICLKHCRTPIGFLMNEWKDGKFGAFSMGLKHGVFCVGCCWLLMALLFVTGVMNLLWVAIVAIYVLIEKIIPSGKWFSRAVGFVIIIYGVLLLTKV